MGRGGGERENVRVLKSGSKGCREGIKRESKRPVTDRPWAWVGKVAFEWKGRELFDSRT